MKHLIVNPIDRFFLRNGTSFNAGESGFIRSIYPPSTSTGYGLSRAVVLEMGCNNIQEYIRQGCKNCPETDSCKVSDVVGNPSKRDGELDVFGPYSVFKESLCFPTPKDLTYNEEDTTGELEPSIVPEESLSSDLGKIRLPSGKEGHRFYKDVDTFLISAKHLETYLEGNSILEKQLIKVRSGKSDTSDSLLIEEPQTGIALTDKHITEEGYLYRIEMLRFNKDASLWFGLDGIPDTLKEGQQQFIMRFGGEGKLASVKSSSSLHHPKADVASKLKQTGQLKLVLLQDADFDGRWIPPEFSNADDTTPFPCTGELNGVHLELVSAFVGRAKYLGGWDTSARRPRDLKPLVPAGSVYYLNIEKNSTDKIVKTLNNTKIGLNTHLGLGHVVVGVWSNE